MQDNNLEEYVIIHGEKMTRSECVRKLVMEENADVQCWKDPGKEGAEVEYSVGDYIVTEGEWLYARLLIGQRNKNGGRK